MREELITFETAKLAKEKGFDWQTRDGYHSDLQDNEFWESWDLYLSDHFKKRLVSQDVYAAPTQSLLQKWLREEYKIFLNSITGYDLGTRFQILYEEEGISFDDLYTNMFETYEEALEEGLQEALKLIK